MAIRFIVIVATLIIFFSSEADSANDESKKFVIAKKYIDCGNTFVSKNFDNNFNPRNVAFLAFAECIEEFRNYEKYIMGQDGNREDLAWEVNKAREMSMDKFADWVIGARHRWNARNTK